tara:strand:- start:4261 stop:5235 length:975 start_codon:yes stop_codon:yes gene_type:complete
VGTTCLGDIDMALDLVTAGAFAGVDAVKFQLIDPDQDSSESTEFKVRWEPSETAENMKDMFKKLEFRPDQWKTISNECKRAGVEFLATVDFEQGVDLLEKLGTPAHKIGAWDTTFKPLITRIAVTGKPMIVDLGPTSQEEIGKINDWFLSSGGKQILYLHDFHTDEPNEMNFGAIKHLQNTLPWPVGFSSPARNDDLDFLALGVGVDVIEKRLILDRSLRAFHSHESLEPNELKQWVERIRFAEKAIGCEEIQPSRKDLADSQKYYRSICTTKPVSKGELFTRDNLSGKRPGIGLPTERLSEFLGRRASRDIGKNTLLREADWT